MKHSNRVNACSWRWVIICSVCQDIKKSFGIKENYRNYKEVMFSDCLTVVEDPHSLSWPVSGYQSLISSSTSRKNILILKLFFCSLVTSCSKWWAVCSSGHVAAFLWPCFSCWLLLLHCLHCCRQVSLTGIRHFSFVIIIIITQPKDPFIGLLQHQGCSVCVSRVRWAPLRQEGPWKHCSPSCLLTVMQPHRRGFLTRSVTAFRQNVETPLIFYYVT